MPNPIGPSGSGRPTRPAPAPLEPAPAKTAKTAGPGLDTWQPTSFAGHASPSRPPAGHGDVLAAGVSLTAGGLRLDGAPAVSGARGPSAERLYEIARRMELADANPFAGREVSNAERRAVIEEVVPFLGAEGRKRRDLLAGRAAAFALLCRVAAAMTTSDESGPRTALVDRLLAAAAGEAHAGLRRHMIVALHDLDDAMTPAARDRYRPLREEVLPSHPPYEKWLEGPRPRVRVRQYVMDEFWRGELASYRERGYTITEQPPHRAKATRTFTDPEGKRPPVQVAVELIQRDTEVLADMDDPEVDVVLYSGHANLGGVARTSIDHGPDHHAGTKLVGFFACRSKQSLGAFAQRYPGSHFLVSRGGTYGHDDRIVIHHLLEGIASRRSYESIRRTAEAEDLWEPNNYLFPHAVESLAHQDGDRDGVADRPRGKPDLLYRIGVRRRDGDDASFAARAPRSSPSRLDGAAIHDAVSWFNTIHFYWAEESGHDRAMRVADRFIGGGWFTGGGDDEIVRLAQERGRDGKRSVRVQVNAAYSHLSPDALAMMVTYAVALEHARRPGEPDATTRLRALSMACAYVSNLVEYGDVADDLVRGFASRFGFPPSLTWEVAETALLKDPTHDASDVIVAALGRALEHGFREVDPNHTSPGFRKAVARALEHLRRSRSPIARATYDLVASGRVAVDELSDLTRPDFDHLRRELRSEGPVIDRDDFVRLRDGRFLRRLGASINGYMWDNRIYVAAGLDPKTLADTLVHEVNHVLNASEDHYDAPVDVLREEYRAVYAEALARGEKLSAKRCRELKAGVIADYGLRGVTPDSVPDVPPGRMLPDGFDGSDGSGRGVS